VTRRSVSRLAVAFLIVSAIVAFYLFGPTESEILSQQAAWKASVAEHLIVALVLFFVVEVILVALSIPLATLLAVIAGVLFGRWIGTTVVSLSSTLGALLAMLAARYVLGEMLRRWAGKRPRWHSALDALDRGIERDGWFYLLLIRLAPVFPFFLINLGMGLTRMRGWTYTWASWLGMLPGTFVYVSAGAEVGQVESFRELASFERLWPLLALVLFAVLLRIAATRYLRRRASTSPDSRSAGTSPVG
jgi:uncharacterized membrane protein YdjX (TVP38/TMEM64 family)